MPDTETSGNAAVPEITIQGVVFAVPPVFKEGHVLTAAEAYTLDQTRRENLRNNFAGAVAEAKLKAAVEKGALTKDDKGVEIGDVSQVTNDDLDVDALQEAFATYADNYEFGVRGSGSPRAPADPVERELQTLALGVIKDAYRAKGFKLPPVADMKALIPQLLTKRPELRQLAAERVAQAKAAPSVSLDDLQL